MPGRSPAMECGSVARDLSPDQSRVLGRVRRIRLGIDPGCHSLRVGRDVPHRRSPRRELPRVHMRTDLTTFSNIEGLIELTRGTGAPAHVVQLNNSARDRPLRVAQHNGWNDRCRAGLPPLGCGAFAQRTRSGRLRPIVDRSTLNPWSPKSGAVSRNRSCLRACVT